MSLYFGLYLQVPLLFFTLLALLLKFRVSKSTPDTLRCCYSRLHVSIKNFHSFFTYLVSFYLRQLSPASRVTVHAANVPLNAGLTVLLHSSYSAYIYDDYLQEVSAGAQWDNALGCSEKPCMHN